MRGVEQISHLPRSACGLRMLKATGRGSGLENLIIMNSHDKVRSMQEIKFSRPDPLYTPASRSWFFIVAQH